MDWSALQRLQKAVIDCTQGGVKFDHSPKEAPGMTVEEFALLTDIAHGVQRLFEIQ